MAFLMLNDGDLQEIGIKDGYHREVFMSTIEKLNLVILNWVDRAILFNCSNFGLFNLDRMNEGCAWIYYFSPNKRIFIFIILMGDVCLHFFLLLVTFNLPLTYDSIFWKTKLNCWISRGCQLNGPTWNFFIIKKKRLDERIRLHGYMGRKSFQCAVFTNSHDSVWSGVKKFCFDFSFEKYFWKSVATSCSTLITIQTIAVLHLVL